MKLPREFASGGFIAALLFAVNPVQAQTISILTGQGNSDASGIPASTARMRSVSTNVTAPDGTLYFTEQSGRVRKITPGGVISTIAGPEPYVFSCAFSGDNGPAASARLCYPTGIARDASGNLYIADGGNCRIRRISTVGIITTFAGSASSPWDCGFSGDGGLAVNAKLDWPSWMTFDANGNLYFTDEGNNRVRKITTAGVISTVAGSGSWGWGWSQPSYSGDGGPATSARLNLPQGLAIDSMGNLYIADRENHRIRKVTPGGIISTIAGSGPTGTNNGDFSGDDGPAAVARLNLPQGLGIDRAGNLFVSDTGNYRVRKIDIAGTITTVAGNGTYTSPVEGAVATSTGLSSWSLSVDSEGNLIVDDDRAMLVKVDMPTVCLPDSDLAECKATEVEDGIVEALDAGSISSAVSNLLLDSLVPIQAKLAWMAANLSSPELARIKKETCSLINQFNTQMDHYVRLRRLPANLRDAWKADMLEVKVQLGCSP